jgi:SAM-dependent methyltransferase
MNQAPPPEARTSEAALRNREPILAALRPHLPPAGLVLEIAAGTGVHAAYNSAALPHLLWQPTDPDPDALLSLAAWRRQQGQANMLAPLRLDAEQPDEWPVEQADVIVNINMIHISRWAATVGLMTGAGRVLPPGGILFMYGPFIEPGLPTAPGNIEFDADLRSRHQDWGLRDLNEVTALATSHGLQRVERQALPANNLAVVFLRTGASPAPHRTAG